MKVMEEASLTGGWSAVYNTQTNSITVFHCDGRNETFSSDQVKEKLASIIKPANGNRFAIVNAFAALSRQDDALSQAAYVASCQCGYDKYYRKFINSISGTIAI